MVEQALEFAGAQSGRKPTRCARSRSASCSNGRSLACQPQLRESGFTDRAESRATCRWCMADAAALLARDPEPAQQRDQSMAASSRWIGLLALVQSGKRGPEVRISVQDRGIGYRAGRSAAYFRAVLPRPRCDRRADSRQRAGVEFGRADHRRAHGGRMTCRKHDRPGQHFHAASACSAYCGRCPASHQLVRRNITTTQGTGDRGQGTGTAKEEIAL